MASSVNRVDTSAFDEVLLQIDNVIRAYGISKNDIISSTDTLLSAWTGKGKDAFHDAYTKLKTELSDEEENLRTIYDDLKAMKDSYEQWDVSVQNSFLEENV